MGRTGTTSTIPRALFLCKKEALVVPNCPTNRTITQSLPFTSLCGSVCTNGAATTTSKQSANFRQSGLVAIYLGKYSVFPQKAYISLAMLKFPRLSNGYGNLVDKTNIKFSSGYYSRIALAREIY